MLNDLLRLLGDGGIHSTAELARRLGVNEPLVTAMTGDLTRRGYLAPVDTGCGTAVMAAGWLRRARPPQATRPRRC